MAISRVEIRNLRNIQALSIDPIPGINIVTGPNGAGKTSILEGIYLLGRGRSFRTNQARPIVREGSDCLEVVGRRLGASALVAGVRRCIKTSEIRINGETVGRLSELARHFPVQLVTPRSHELLERGPDIRRRFLDWGLFHVEPGYGGLVARYNRVLKQRNVALKKKPSDVHAWDPQIAEFGEQIHILRERYLNALNTQLLTINSLLGLESPPVLTISRSWARDEALLQGLRRRYSADSLSGFTSVGPHRDDFKVHYQGSAAVDRLSRGQQKMVVLGLTLAQLSQVSNGDSPKPILLVDDLAAELDDHARERVMNHLSEAEIQVFVSALDPRVLLERATTDAKVFHVEQGSLRI